MSYEAWGEPDDPPELPDGCIDADTADELRELLKHVNFDPAPGDRSAAALVLIEHILCPPTDPTKPEDPTITWAKTLLKDVVGGMGSI